MRVLFLLAGVALAAGCAKNPDPVPDYPVSDELLVADPDELGVDLEPRSPSPEPTGGGEEDAEEPAAEESGAVEGAPADVEPPPP
jgi:hypothetical protein